MRLLKRQIDRWAIRAAAKSLPRLPADPAQATEVHLLLNRNNLFTPPEQAPAVSLQSGGCFEFDSSVRTPFPINNRVHGRLFPTKGNWKERPSVVLLHGWNAEMHYTSVLPSVARAIVSCGMNAVLFELPFHLHRRPARGEAMTNFISENIPRMLEATKQAVADLNSIVHWLKSEGSPAVATWGFSLGGWLVGLHVCASAVQDAAILMTPVSDLQRAVQDLEFCHPIRAALQVAPADFTELNLASRTPQIPADKILLVEAAYDLFVPSHTYGELAHAWHLTGWEKVRQSHITILFSRSAMKQSIEWLERKLL